MTFRQRENYGNKVTHKEINEWILVPTNTINSLNYLEEYTQKKDNCVRLLIDFLMIILDYKM